MDQLQNKRSGQRVLTVSQLTQLIKSELEDRFPEVWVEGEISNFRPYHSGHVYFTLKDSQAQLRAVLFRSAAQRVPFALQDGLKVVCRGAISVYEPRGEYQIIVEEVIPRGKGALQLAFEQLKEKLKKEGLFAAELKKKLPLLPKKVGVVTSPHGAAIVDILRTLERRFARLHIIIYPVRVQGEGAAEEIVEGIQFLSAVPNIDAIIVGRGGGSIEDLWAFNEEIVARAIFACPVPIISAVGHEIDFTIADFVADLRASTPSAAAEVLIEKEQAFEERINNLFRRLGQRIENLLEKQRHAVVVRIQHRAFQNFKWRLLTWGQRIDDLEGKAKERIVSLFQDVQASQAQVRLAREKIANAMQKKLSKLSSTWEKIATHLDGVSPLSVLRKGYALCWRQDGRQIIRQASDVLVKDEVIVSFYRGELSCLVQKVDALKTIESMLSKESK
ncbi:MAG TPA: exodeoxyribonuclease VII large subunit [Candidatus Aminicenantes bacterium]|nr:exodeoxyribonuclease VII large subunit [Candidatus Aminicenantes bacterium]